MGESAKEEKADGYTKTAEALEKGKDVAEKAYKLGGKELPESIAKPLDVAIAPVQVRDEANKMQEAASHGDYTGATGHALNGMKSGAEFTEGTATILGAAGVEGAESIAAMANPVGAVLGTAAGGFKVGQETAKLADNRDYADGRYGKTQEGRNKTAMDKVIDDANAGNAGVGGGWFGKIAAINNAAVGGVIHGFEGAVENGLSRNPKELQRGQQDAQDAFQNRWKNQLTADNQLGPAPSNEALGGAVSRLNLKAIDAADRDRIGRDPNYAAMVGGARSMDPAQQQSIAPKPQIAAPLPKSE